MGIFGKLKENFQHGGVKLGVQAPASVSMQDAAVPVDVVLTASDEAQTINNITVQIVAQQGDKAFNENDRDTTPYERTVAKSEYAQAFGIAPGETKTVRLNIVMNAGAALGQQLPEGGAGAQIAGALQKIQSLSEAMNGNSYEYFIEAFAEIEGIKLGPSHRQSIQLLKPGQFGINIRGGL